MEEEEEEEEVGDDFLVCELRDGKEQSGSSFLSLMKSPKDKGEVESNLQGLVHLANPRVRIK